MREVFGPRWENPAFGQIFIENNTNSVSDRRLTVAWDLVGYIASKRRNWFARLRRVAQAASIV